MRAPRLPRPCSRLQGDDRYMGDYLRSEFLDRVSRAEVAFLTRTSILDRLCGPLCDAILNVRGSDRVLERLDKRNLLVVPLDHRREWYRYHQLFRQLLYAELTRREADKVPLLHLRAAAWHEGNGGFEAAIEHAQAANDANWVGRLVLTWMQPVWASGRVDTVLQLVGVARGQTVGRALFRRRSPRGPHPRHARPSRRGRTLGRICRTIRLARNSPQRRHHGRPHLLHAGRAMPAWRRANARATPELPWMV